MRKLTRKYQTGGESISTPSPIAINSELSPDPLDASDEYSSLISAYNATAESAPYTTNASSTQSDDPSTPIPSSAIPIDSGSNSPSFSIGVPPPTTSPVLDIFSAKTPFSDELLFRMFRDYVNQRESSGRKDAKTLRSFNSLGYVGAFQFGSIALTEVGLLKRNPTGSSNKSRILLASNWIGGATARDTFLSSYTAQEDALRTLTKKNFSYAKSALASKGITSPTQTLALLSGAHLLGNLSIRNYIKNDFKDTKKDANNSTISSYYNGFINYTKGQYRDGQGTRQIFDMEKNILDLISKGHTIDKSLYKNHSTYSPKDAPPFLNPLPTYKPPTPGVYPTLPYGAGPFRPSNLDVLR